MLAAKSSRTTLTSAGSQPSLVFNTYANPQDSANRKAAVLLDSIISQEEAVEDKGQYQATLNDENIIQM